jgi:hypothetical protein
MSQLILEFPLESDAVSTSGEEIRVELGNGVRLTSTVPTWIGIINSAKLSLVMEVTGSPPDAS